MTGTRWRQVRGTVEDGIAPGVVRDAMSYARVGDQITVTFVVNETSRTAHGVPQIRCGDGFALDQYDLEHATEITITGPSHTV